MRSRPRPPSKQHQNSHLPHGLYEKQLLGFFAQFGRVSRVRVARSKRTARAKGYAYVEFAHSGVAEVAAGAMDGHLLLKQALSVRCLPRSEVHPELFRGAERAFRAIPWGKIEAARHNAPRTPDAHAKRAKRAASRDAARRRKLAAAGIAYEYDDVLGAAAVKAAAQAAAAAGGGAGAAEDKKKKKQGGKEAGKQRGEDGGGGGGGKKEEAGAAARKRRAPAAAAADGAAAPALKKRAAAVAGAKKKK